MLRSVLPFLAAFSVTATAVASSSALLTDTFTRPILDDVSADHWAYPAIEWVLQEEIMTGTGVGIVHFAPNRPATRAELAAVAARLALWMEERYYVSQSSSAESVQSSARSASSASSDGRVVPAQGIFLAVLTGSEQVPQVETGAKGTGVFVLDGSDLQYAITVSGLTGPIIAAHFHQAIPGESGPAVEAITFEGLHAQGRWVGLTQDERDAILRGDIYVNVHTDTQPDGEIRGQLRDRLYEVSGSSVAQ
ncbi:MAG: CHRD domain-containing protein [Candidatus Peregrinibacteria bacterium]|nr:CHRD domain-containing protein [Candidatus Peregrinibacteria bacterium]